MVRIRKSKGGSGIGRHWWPEDDPVCDVPEPLARDLLADPEWGYSIEPDPEPEPEDEDDSGEDDGEPDEGEDDEEPEPSPPPARKRKPAASA